MIHEWRDTGVTPPDPPPVENQIGDLNAMIKIVVPKRCPFTIHCAIVMSSGWS